jgi:ABC-type uncharacterized transport system substrate-binding protein
VREAAGAFGLKLEVINASAEHDIDAAFSRMVEVRAGALVVFSGPFLFGRRETIVALAAAHALPAIYTLSEFVAAGGLMSYDTNIPDAPIVRRPFMSAAFLRSEKPGDLTVVLPTKYELVINFKAAKALALNIPPNLLALADQVIE